PNLPPCLQKQPWKRWRFRRKGLAGNPSQKVARFAGRLRGKVASMAFPVSPLREEPCRRDHAPGERARHDGPDNRRRPWQKERDSKLPRGAALRGTSWRPMRREPPKACLPSDRERRTALPYLPAGRADSSTANLSAW